MPGARCTRSLVCARVVSMHTSIHSEPPETTGIPARNGFNSLFRALPGDRAFLSPSSADQCSSGPVGPTRLRELDAGVEASGPHDFTVRSTVVRLRAVDRSRAVKPALRSHHTPTLPRPPHPAPTFVTMANAPLWAGTARVIEVIWVRREQKYFTTRARQPNSPPGKSARRMGGAHRRAKITDCQSLVQDIHSALIEPKQIKKEPI